MVIYPSNWFSLMSVLLTVGFAVTVDVRSVVSERTRRLSSFVEEGTLNPLVL